MKIESRWELAQLYEVIELISGQSPKSEYYNTDKRGLPFYQGKNDYGDLYLNEPTVWTEYTTKESIKGDILMSVRAPVGPVNLNPFERICIGRGLNALRPKNNLHNLYLFYYLKYNQNQIQGNDGIAFQSISRDRILEIKIPLPPKDTQQKIVSEIEILEKQEEKAVEKIEKLKNEIEEYYTEYKKGTTKRLDEVCELKAGKFVKAGDIEKLSKPHLFPCYGGNGLRGYTETYTNEGMFSLVGRQGALCGNVHLVDGKFHATEHTLVAYPKENVNTLWLHYKLVFMNLNQYATGTAQPGLSVMNLKPIEILLPPFSEQQKIVSEIEKIEQKITDLEKQIAEIPKLKETVLKKYLE